MKTKFSENMPNQLGLLVIQDCVWEIVLFWPENSIVGKLWQTSRVSKMPRYSNLCAPFLWPYISIKMLEENDHEHQNG